MRTCKRFAATLIVATGASLMLAACGSDEQALQNAANGPDAYAVYRPADLSTPPEFKRRPTKQDDKVKKVQTQRQVYRYASKRNDEIPAHWRQSSRGTQAFLYQLGAQNAEPGIRVTINRETSIYLEEKAAFVEDLLFGQKPAADNGVTMSRDTEGLLDKIF